MALPRNERTSAYGLHAEPQYNHLARRLKIKLDCEIEPYLTRTKAIKKLGDKAVSGLLDQRRPLESFVRLHAPHAMRLCGSWCQVAKVDVPDLDRMSVEDLRRTVREASLQMGTMVGNFLESRTR